jgi:hypothetical protein
MKADTGIGNENPKKVKLDIPTRLQWENGHGFCGETCIQIKFKFKLKLY